LKPHLTARLQDAGPEDFVLLQDEPDLPANEEALATQHMPWSFSAFISSNPYLWVVIQFRNCLNQIWHQENYQNDY
jgi:hypothetical protein